MGCIAATALATAALVVSIGCGGGGEEGRPQQKGPLVELEPAVRGEISRSIELTAEVAPVDTVQISSTVEGPIGFFPWREGDLVEAGEKLVEIDRATYRAEAKAAEAALSVAKAKLDDLRAGERPEEIEKARQAVREVHQSAAYEEDELRRVAELVEIGALPGEDVDKARVQHIAAQSRLEIARRQLEKLQRGPTRTAVAVQEASVEEAAARFELARAHLNECVIEAPFAGVITKTFVRRGGMAAAKSPLLELADMTSLVLRFAVPEAYAAEVRKGMSVTARLDAIPGKEFTAEVIRVYPELDPKMRTRTMEAAMSGASGIAPHMFARVTLNLARADGVLIVPAEALLVTPDGQHRLFVVADGKAQARDVTIGIEDGARVQIISGLDPGEKVVVAGNEQLEPGMPVRVAGQQGGGAKTQRPGRASRAGSGAAEGGQR